MHLDRAKSNSILQWNINGLIGNRNELKHLISHYNPFCVALNETRSNNTHTIIKRSFKNYSCHIDPKNLNSGNMILIRRDINFVPVTLRTTLNAIAIEINKNDKRIRICSIYLSPNIPIAPLELSELINQLSPSSSPVSFLILGDFNARSEYWHDSINNTRGNQILDLILQYNLDVLNEDSATHFNLTHGCQTNIDLSLCTQDLTSKLYWHTHPDLCSSDHYPILIHFLDFSSSISKFHWKLDKADWSLFNFSTRNIIYDENKPCSTNLQIFMDRVLKAAKECIPFSDSFSLKTCNPWWNEECKRAKREKNRARRKYLKTKNPVDLIEFKRLKAVARRTYNVAQKTSWQTYVSSINSDTPLKQIWKRINKIRQKYNGSHIPTLKIDNQLLNEPKKVANCLAEFISDSSKGLTNTSSSFATKKIIEERKPINFSPSKNHTYNIAFTLDELRTTLSECSESSPGQDNIPYSLLKHLHKDALVFLLNIYNEIWFSGYFPPEWRKAVVLPFLKPGKNPMLPQSYRPIALTSCLCKLLERIVNFRLMWHLENNGLISPHQYGFRKNRSTLDPLTLIENDIGNAFSNKKFITAVFFDIEKAYDTVWRHHILKVLKFKGLEGNLPIFISNFLSPRYFKVDINGYKSEEYIQYEGVPQGSILSTTCFILAIDGIVNDLPSNVKCSLYICR